MRTQVLKEKAGASFEIEIFLCVLIRSDDVVGG
jgi:hypothetical protein